MVATVIWYMVLAFVGGVVFGSVLGYLLCTGHRNQQEVDRRIQQMLRQ